MALPEGSLIKPLLQKRYADVTKAKAKRSPGQIQGAVGEMPMTRGFQGALAAQHGRSGKPGVIAELKSTSPFDTSFRRPVNFKDLAEDLEAVGATCLSVGANRQLYGVSFSDLATVQTAVKIPVLARDLIVDMYQILEARLAGADAVVLIAGLIGDKLPLFIERATTVALDSVVQVHTKEDLDRALAAGATLISVTSRNIHSFALEPEARDTLLPLIPPDRALAVAEGGLGSQSDLEAMGKLGAKAILIGSAMIKDPDPAGVLEQVLGIETTG